MRRRVSSAGSSLPDVSELVEMDEADMVVGVVVGVAADKKLCPSHDRSSHDRFSYDRKGPGRHYVAPPPAPPCLGSAPEHSGGSGAVAEAEAEPPVAAAGHGLSASGGEAGGLLLEAQVRWLEKCRTPTINISKMFFSKTMVKMGRKKSPKIVLPQN